MSSQIVRTAALERKEVSLEAILQVEDWQQRFQLLDQLPDPEVKDIPLLEKALKDEQMSIRRLSNGLLRDD